MLGVIGGESTVCVEVEELEGEKGGEEGRVG
jgi:hypothetical protein